MTPLARTFQATTLKVHMISDVCYTPWHVFPAHVGAHWQGCMQSIIVSNAQLADHMKTTSCYTGQSNIHLCLPFWIVGVDCDSIRLIYSCLELMTPLVRTFQAKTLKVHMISDVWYTPWPVFPAHVCAHWHGCMQSRRLSNAQLVDHMKTTSCSTWQRVIIPDW